MQLMQKCEKEEGVFGIEDLDRWPVDSYAFGFLSATVSTNSIASLQKVSQSISIEAFQEY
jgi:hypothetical protein